MSKRFGLAGRPREAAEGDQGPDEEAAGEGGAGRQDLQVSDVTVRIAVFCVKQNSRCCWCIQTKGLGSRVNLGKLYLILLLIYMITYLISSIMKFSHT